MVTETTPLASVLQTFVQVFFLASIKVDHVRCTAKQSQESMFSLFSLFPPLESVVWRKKKESPSLSCWGCKGWHVVGRTDATSLERPLLIAFGVSLFLFLPCVLLFSFCRLCRLLHQWASPSSAASGSLTHLRYLGTSRAENKSFSRSARVTENPLPRLPSLLFFLLYFPPVFKQNIAPCGDQMTAIKGNLRARGWCCFSRGPVNICSMTKWNTACFPSNETTFGPARSWKSAWTSGFSSYLQICESLLKLLSGGDSGQPRSCCCCFCVCFHCTPGTGGSAVWLLLGWNVEAPCYCQSASFCLFVFCLSRELQCEDPGFCCLQCEDSGKVLAPLRNCGELRKHLMDWIFV